MQRKKPARTRRNSWESEHAISSASLKLLLEHGYEGLSISKVAALAKASKATIYKRWPTKDHLVLEAFSQLSTLVPQDTGSLLEDLMDLHIRYFAALQDSPLRSVLTRLMSECISNPSLQGAMEPWYEQRRMPLRLIFSRAIRRGELPKDADTEIAIDLLHGAVIMWACFATKETPEEWLTRLFQSVLTALGSSPAVIVKPSKPKSRKSA